MKKVCILFLIFNLIVLIGCYEDKGNYNYIDYNEIIDITNVRDLTKTSIVLGDTIVIVIDITWKYPDKDTTMNAYDFRWEIDDKIVSAERNLEYIPDECGSKTAFLYVTEKATGIVFRYTASLSITSPYNVGWMLLSEIGGRPCITYIRRDSRVVDEETVYYWTDFVDIYSDLHPDKPLVGKPIFIDAYIMDYYDDEVMILFEEGDGVILNGLDFSQFIPVSSLFPSGYPQGFKPVAWRRGGTSDFMVGSNGELYSRLNTATTQLYHETRFLDVPVYFPKGSYITEIMKIQNSKHKFELMFDELNNRLVACNASFTSNDNNTGGKMDIMNTYDPSEFADITDLSGYKLIYCNDHSNGTIVFTILKDMSTGTYIYQEFKFQITTTTLTVTDANQEQFKANDFVSDNTIYWRMKTTSFLYFAEGSKLYFLDFLSDEIKLYHDFGSATITHLLEDADATRLGVVLDNGSFYLCDALSNDVLIAPNPGEVGILHHVSGLGDIKSITWKWGGWYKMNGRNY